VIDISPEGGVVSALKESKIECMSADKVPISLIYFFMCCSTHPHLGCLLVLLPPALPRQVSCISGRYRWDQKAIASVGVTWYQGLAFALADGTATATEEPG
jgi:hypothetical protein